MGKIMYKNRSLFIVIIGLFAASAGFAADRYVTLIIDGTGSKASSSVNVGANEVAWVVWVSAHHDQNPKTEVSVTYGAGTVALQLREQQGWNYNLRPNLPLVGPCTIIYSTTDTGGSVNNMYLATVKIQPNPNINGIGQ